MLQKIGAVGIVGLLFVIGGLVLVALIEPVIAGGMALVIAGIGLLAYGLISSFMQSMGLMGPPGV